jgi:hypothetical protein
MARREDGLGPARPIEAVPPPAAEDPTWERLDEQLGWYDRKSRDNQRRYQWLNTPTGVRYLAGQGAGPGSG